MVAGLAMFSAVMSVIRQLYGANRNPSKSKYFESAIEPFSRLETRSLDRFLESRRKKREVSETTGRRKRPILYLSEPMPDSGWVDYALPSLIIIDEQHPFCVAKACSGGKRGQS